MAGLPVAGADTEEKQLLDQALNYFWYFERFHWRYEDVEECPQWLAARLPTVAAVHDEVVAEKQKAAAKKAAG